MVPPFGHEMLPAFKKPLPTASVLLPLLDRARVIRPETDRVTPELMFNVAEVPVGNTAVPHAASAVTVTVKPDASVTSSPTTGTCAGDHVVVLFQFPLPADVMAVALADEAPRSRANRNTAAPIGKARTIWLR